MQRGKGEPTAATAATAETAATAAPLDLAEAIRGVSAGLDKLFATGLNRRAIIVLLDDSTGVGKRNIEKVLDGLSTLAKDFTQGGSP